MRAHAPAASKSPLFAMCVCVHARGRRHDALIRRARGGRGLKVTRVKGGSRVGWCVCYMYTLRRERDTVVVMQSILRAVNIYVCVVAFCWECIGMLWVAPKYYEYLYSGVGICGV